MFHMILINYSSLSLYLLTYFLASITYLFQLESMQNLPALLLFLDLLTYVPYGINFVLQALPIPTYLRHDQYYLPTSIRVNTKSLSTASHPRPTYLCHNQQYLPTPIRVNARSLSIASHPRPTYLYSLMPCLSTPGTQTKCYSL